MTPHTSTAPSTKLIRKSFLRYLRVTPPVLVSRSGVSDLTRLQILYSSFHTTSHQTADRRAGRGLATGKCQTEPEYFIFYKKILRSHLVY